MTTADRTYTAMLQGPNPIAPSETIELEYVDGRPQDIVVLDFETEGDERVVRTYRLVNADTDPVSYEFVDEATTVGDHDIEN